MTPDNSNADDDYRGEHTAPGPHYGAPLHDVSSGGMYPADFYGPKGRRLYASEGWDFDNDAYNKVTRVKDKPNEMVSIHRAIPTSVYNEALKKDAPLKHMIRKGDWVAISKEYARAHGDHVLGKLNKDYKIASMRVPAKHVWTNADSIHEWGYHPDEKASGGIIRKARGGTVQPTIEQMRQALAKGGSAKEPKSTVKAYKLFRVHKDHPGKLFPLFVDANTPVEMNKWVDAKEGEMSNGKVKSKIGALAYRPGWHAGDLPIATHIGEKSDPSLTAPDRRPANHAWAEVEMPNDVDWQTEANKRGTNAQGKLVPVKAHITDQIPKGGHYRYKTNPNMTGNWLIGGSMKVNKVLSDAEVERINKKAGMADLPRTEPFAKKTFGFAHGGSASGCIAPEEWKAEEYVNHKAKGGKVKPTQHEMRQALLHKASGGVVRMAGGGDPSKMLRGNILAGASWNSLNPTLGDALTKYNGMATTNTAIGGATTYDTLNQLNNFLDAGGSFEKGANVFLQTGGLDLVYGDKKENIQNNIEQIVSKLEDQGVNVVLTGSPYAKSFDDVVSNTFDPQLDEIYSNIALNHPNVQLVDSMGEILQNKDLLSDFIHPNAQGWEVYNQSVLDAAKRFAPQQTTGSASATTDIPVEEEQTYIETPPVGGLPVDLPIVADKETNINNQAIQNLQQPVSGEQFGAPLQQASMGAQSPNPPQEAIQQMSYKMPEYEMESNKSFKDAGDFGGVMERAKGGEVRSQQPFDYENPSHVQNVANIAAKHRDFNQIPDAAKHLAGVLSQGSYKFVEDPRIQSAIKQAGHNGYYISGKDGKEQIIRKAEGGAVLPIERIKAQMMDKFKGLNTLQSIGADEAPSLGVKAYVPTVGRPDNGRMPVGGVDTSRGDLPVGGIDMSKMQPGQQMMPAGQQPGMDQVPQGDKTMTMDGTGMPPSPNANPNQMGSNILSMTPQGQAMAALKPQGLAKGGSAKSTADMKAELAAKKSIKDGTSTRVKIDAEGPGGVKGIVVPRHMWEGKTYKGEGGKKVEGMRDVNEARAKVYGSERRDPLNSGQMNSLHKKVLAEHFAKPLHEQTAAEEEALNRLREAKHIGKTANTLDKSEKLDTVNHEEDAQGRNYVGFASKGVAGHSLYTSGHGKDQKHHVINTCAGQTVGCGGGTDKNGIVDTSRGTCFAPNAESQYVNAAVRRASHEQAKHDPAMSKDWILAHTGSLRNAAENADKKNKVLLFRPNVVDETDVTSRHAIRHLNDQRKATGKPNIEANSYGKTNELHDPENGYHVTHSNVGPKTKKGASIEENISRDKARVRNTILAADNKGDFKNEQGNKTPPKGSYMVTDVKRGSPLSKKMEENITHAKYWSTGRPKSELTPEEISQGDEGHFGGDHKPTTEDKAHYGHKTVKDLRFDYQKQHVLHPRLVQVGHNEDGSKHMIPTDSRFKDTEFLPKDRFKSKNGKDAGHILMTTPTESTSSIGHQTSFTHHVNEGHIEHAKKNNGEYEIDKPEDQIKSAGKEYVAPQAVKFYADGGEVSGRHPGLSDDDFHAFPEQNYAAQRHMALRGHDRESKHSLSDNKHKVTMNKDMDTMLLELTRNKKAK